MNLDGSETVIFEADAVAMDEEQPKDSKENIRIASISGKNYAKYLASYSKLQAVPITSWTKRWKLEQ